MQVRTLNECGHIFHQGCIDERLKRQGNLANTNMTVQIAKQIFPIADMLLPYVHSLRTYNRVFDACTIKNTKTKKIKWVKKSLLYNPSPPRYRPSPGYILQTFATSTFVKLLAMLLQPLAMAILQILAKGISFGETWPWRGVVP